LLPWQSALRSPHADRHLSTATSRLDLAFIAFSMNLDHRLHRRYSQPGRRVRRVRSQYSATLTSLHGS
jgi:hypothetical protein